MGGVSATELSFRRAVDAELADARSRPGSAFKVPLARNVVVRTLEELAATEKACAAARSRAALRAAGCGASR